MIMEVPWEEIVRGSTEKKKSQPGFLKEEILCGDKKRESRLKKKGGNRLLPKKDRGKVRARETKQARGKEKRQTKKKLELQKGGLEALL